MPLSLPDPGAWFRDRLDGFGGQAQIFAERVHQRLQQPPNSSLPPLGMTPEPIQLHMLQVPQLFQFPSLWPIGRNTKQAKPVITTPPSGTPVATMVAVDSTAAGSPPTSSEPISVPAVEPIVSSTSIIRAPSSHDEAISSVAVEATPAPAAVRSPGWFGRKAKAAHATYRPSSFASLAAAANNTLPGYVMDAGLQAPVPATALATGGSPHIVMTAAPGVAVTVVAAPSNGQITAAVPSPMYSPAPAAPLSPPLNSAAAQMAPTSATGQSLSATHSASMEKKAELGRCTWLLLHTLAAQFPQTPTRQQQKDARALIDALGRIYPCGDCAQHFAKVIKQDPPTVRSGQELQQWMCRAHNAVNARLSKPAFNCDFVDARWTPLDCGEESSCDLTRVRHK